jgi:hypothetical protein
MIKVLTSLTMNEAKETMAGMISIFNVLGLVHGIRAIYFCSIRQFKAMIKGEGVYEEEAKIRIWYKMYFLKVLYDYLKKTDQQNAYILFEKIIEKPGKVYVGRFAPPTHLFTKNYTLHQAWKDFIRKDDQIKVTVDEPVGNASSLHVTRCFMNEVVRDLNIMPIAELICGCDFQFWKDYHPNVKFSRDKTLLRGDAYCNHTLTWIEPGEAINTQNSLIKEV